jgi:hypothetical protein
MGRAPVYPKGLGPRGKRLWKDTVDIRPRLGPGERVLLEEACRLTDRLEALNALIWEAKPMVVNTDPNGTTYTVLVDAPSQEARLATATLRSLMQSLGLDRLSAPTPVPLPGSSPSASKAPEPPAVPADPLDEITARRKQRDSNAG